MKPIAEKVRGKKVPVGKKTPVEKTDMENV
jgi:hypothetical protein